MILYLVSCTACFLFGYGALTVLTYRRPLTGAIFAAPVVGVALIVVILVNGVLQGITLKTLTQIIVVLVIFVGTYGIVKLWRTRVSATEIVSGIATILCPIFILAPFFRWGLTAYPGSWFWDGWNYVGYAQDLIDRADPNLVAKSMLHQHLVLMGIATSRFAGSALIGFLSLVSGGADAQFGYGLFLALELFVFASACGFFAATYCRGGERLTPIYLTCAATGGWILGVVQANNVDSLALLAFGPFLVGLMLATSPKSLTEAFVFGVGLAATVLIQTELAPLLIAAPSLIWLQRIFSEGRIQFVYWIRWIFVVALTFVAGSATWLPHAIVFFQNQWRGSQLVGAARPGFGMFPGLLNPYCGVSSFWGFWSPLEACAPVGFLALVTLTATLFSVLIAVGIGGLLGRRNYAIPGAATVFLLGAIIMVIRQHYDYGAYKFLLIGWFLFAFVLVEGGILAIATFRVRRPILLATVILIVPQLLIVGLRIKSFDASRPVKDMSYYRQITEVRGFLQDQPVLLATDNPEAFEWAVFYLRNLFLVPIRYDHPYFKTAREQQAFLQLQKETLDKAQWLLTDASSSPNCGNYNLVWGGGAYRLWRLPDANWVIAGKIKNPNGIEDWNGVLGMWIGDQAVQWTIISNVDGKITVGADFAPGPSIPESPERTLEITTSSGYTTSIVIAAAEKKNISIPMSRGLNWLKLRVIEHPTMIKQQNGDTRALLLSMRAFKVCPN